MYSDLNDPCRISSVFTVQQIVAKKTFNENKNKNNFLKCIKQQIHRLISCKLFYFFKIYIILVLYDCKIIKKTVTSACASAS